ncbi:MAG: response regulator transcription factor [Ignavibacteriae bacterium]|nr:response regulator transcription factor [Ignavibacteria bacterium]MBI3363774.1 response regulator transcription factor [Ignavibacteriota bacterium]
MMILGVREFLSLHSHIEVIGTTTSGEEAIHMARELAPDILLIDISLPGISGIEATRGILRDIPDARIILLTMHDDEEHIRQFVRSGAYGYVLKKNTPDELIRAIETVMKGQTFISPSVASMLLKYQRKEEENGHDELSGREEEVLIWIAKGFTSKEIADKLCISVRTVSKHREMLMSKLNLHSVADLTKYAIAKKLITF